MKVLQINNYNYMRGGSEKVFLDTISLLTKKGHEVYIFSTFDERNVNNDNSLFVKVKDFWKYNTFYKKVTGFIDFVYNDSVAVELDAFVKKVKPDIAHLHIFYGKLSNSVVQILKDNKIPFVITLHEYRLLCPNYTFLRPDSLICEKCAKKKIKIDCIRYKCNKNNYLYSFLSVVETIIRDLFYNPVKNAKGFIAVSKFIMEKHLEYIPSLNNKIKHIYNFVNIRELSKYRKDIEKKDEYYLYFGRLSYEKGLITLLNAFKMRPGLKLYIVGTGPLEDEILRKVSEENLNVKLLGFKTGSELYEIISNAKYSVVPSEWFENNPITILESLSIGTPVIASKIGGLPELISDSYNGYLFEHKNVTSLINVLDKSENEKKYQRLVINSIMFAEENFNDRSYYQKLMQFYISKV